MVPQLFRGRHCMYHGLRSSSWEMPYFHRKHSFQPNLTGSSVCAFGIKIWCQMEFEVALRKALPKAFKSVPVKCALKPAVSVTHASVIWKSFQIVWMREKTLLSSKGEVVPFFLRELGSFTVATVAAVNLEMSHTEFSELQLLMDYFLT